MTPTRPGAAPFLGIALLAGAVMFFEIALLRVFSFTIWHHFAFMVVSIALLGFGVSGVLLQLRPSLGEPAAERAGGYATGFGLSAVVATALACALPLSPTELWRDPAQLAYLLGFYLAFTVPFAFAGLAIVSLLNGFPARVSGLYASDLFAAGLGSVLSVLALRPLGAQGTVLAGAALAAVAGAVMSRGGRRRLGHLAVAGTLAALVPLGERVIPVSPGPSKGMAQVLAEPGATVLHSEWSPLGRVDAIQGGGAVTWTSNVARGTQSDSQTMLIIDGDAATPVIPLAGEPKALRFLDFTLSSAVYQLFHPRRALVVGAGGGVDVLTALHHGAGHVDAVEINDIIHDLMLGPFLEQSGGLFRRPDVTLHDAEGRAFIRGHQGLWDSIQLSLVDTWAASSSGAYALTEGYLYTVEAFTDYLSHLEAGGVLTLTRWVSATPRESLKLLAVADHALRGLGAERPGDHIVMIGLDRLGSLMVKRTPFSEEELDRLGRIVNECGYHFYYAPALEGDNAFVRYFAAPDRDAFLDAYVFDVTPATDDSPFFFQFGRWRDLFAAGATSGDLAGASTGRGLLVAVLGQATLASLVLLVLPLWRRRSPPGGPRLAVTGTGTALGYFFLIGLAFMFVEISLMQRFTLYLGHPVYAVAFVLAVLLAAAGAGSFASKRWSARPDPVFAAVVVLVLGSAVGLPPLFEATLGLPTPARLATGALLLAPLGFLLGMPFPMAMARLGARSEAGLVGWAWSANGCASVLGPVLASLLAFDLGFANVTLVAGALYALAWLAFRRGLLEAMKAPGE